MAAVMIEPPLLHNRLGHRSLSLHHEKEKLSSGKCLF